MKAFIKTFGINRNKLGPLVIAFALQILILLVAVSVMVFSPRKEQVSKFVATARDDVTRQHQEHNYAVAEFERAMGTPPIPNLISVEALLPNSLPSLPESQSLQEISSFDSSALLGSEGLFGDLDSLSAITEGIDFFGIQDAAERVVIVVDTSNSMFRRTRSGQQYLFDFQVIKDEVSELIDKLGMGCEFNLAIYEGGSMAWQDSLVLANRNNKRKASRWVQGLDERPGVSITTRKSSGLRLLEGGGTRLDTALKQVFSFQPEAIFIVTDGEINRVGERIGQGEMLSIIDALQITSKKPVRIHVVHYATQVARPDELSLMRAIASHNQGHFRQVEASMEN